MSTKPPPPDVMAGKMQGMTFTFLRTLLLVVCRVLFRMRIDGLNNVPREGGVLVVSNHLHNADPVLISIAFPRPLHYMAKRELIEVPLLGRFIQWGGSFPVDRGRADRKAIQMAVERLGQGVAVGMFPEGTRSVTRRIERALPGAGLIALKGGSPILPVAIVGSERLPFNGSKGLAKGESQQRGWWKVRITIGEPFMLEPGPDGKRIGPDAAMDQAMSRVAAMLPEANRGIYGDDRDGT